jgi:hypothetical protein
VGDLALCAPLDQRRPDRRVLLCGGLEIKREVMIGELSSLHQIKVPHVPDLVRWWTAAVRLRAACVESDEDTLAAL